MEWLTDFSVTVDPPREARLNMELDGKLALAVRAGSAPTTLRVYGWDRSCITLGRRQRLADLPPSLLERGLPAVHRPTGGGAVLHGPEDLAYAFCAGRSSVPRRLSFREIPFFLHGILREALVSRGWVPAADLQIQEEDPAGPSPFCFSAPARGDLLYRGCKVAGAAVRVWRDGILVQGALQGFPLARDQFAKAFLDEEILPVPHS